MIHWVLHGVLDMGRGGAQLKQHAKPLQLASCSVLVAPVGENVVEFRPVLWGILYDKSQLMCRHLQRAAVIRRMTASRGGNLFSTRTV